MEEEREIDLGRYLRIWMRYWYIPIACACVGVLAAFLLIASRPPSYRARVLLAVMWGAPGTLSTEPQAAPSVSDPASRKQLLASIRELSTSSAVAQAVLDRMRDQLPEDKQHLASLLAMVGSQVVSGSDLIALTVQYPNQGMALALADAWSGALIQQVHELYGGSNRRLLQTIRVQLTNTQERYNRAQVAWEDALRNDHQAQFQREIDERASLAGSLSAARQQILPTLLGEIARLESLLADAQDLRSQIQAGGSISGHVHVLTLLKMRAAGLESGVGGATQEVGRGGQWMLQLQAEPSSMTAAEMSRDLESLIAVLEIRLSMYRDDLRALAESLRLGQNPQALYLSRQDPAAGDPVAKQLEGDIADGMARLDQDIRDLRATLAQEEGKVQAAKMEYDLAREQYMELARVESELAVKEAITADSLQLATPAMILGESTNRLASLGVGGLLGLVLGALVALMVEARRGDLAGHMPPPR